MIGIETSPISSVIVNSFQDPFLPERGARVGRSGGATEGLARLREEPGLEARWILKQVQDDDFAEGLLQ
ncbi:MAG: hypothetical protein JWQ16_1447 [Novosphingobium sp.]|nr:hypothetical protein [Novosphingobium sp.]